MIDTKHLRELLKKYENLPNNYEIVGQILRPHVENLLLSEERAQKAEAELAEAKNNLGQAYIDIGASQAELAALRNAEAKPLRGSDLARAATEAHPAIKSSPEISNDQA